MREPAFHRQDGAMFVVGESGQVYEVRAVPLSLAQLEAQVVAGILTPDAENAAPPVSRGTRQRAHAQRRLTRGALALV